VQRARGGYVWLQSSESRHRHRIVTLQHQRHDAVATTGAFSGLASSQTPGGSHCACKNAAAVAVVAGESYRDRFALYDCPSVGPGGGSPTSAVHVLPPGAFVCAAKRQFAHLGPDHAARQGQSTRRGLFSPPMT
jgi:hypothetical protein